MTTKNMPTTNQAPERTLAEKIPPALAAGFKKTVTSVGKTVTGELKKAASGMGNA